MPLQTVTRPGGTIAVDVDGTGPLVVLVPGMGETRHSYRHLAPGLVAAGYRVASMDLRGHGDSSAAFGAYDDESIASDILAVIEELDGAPAVVVGNSLGAAAGVVAAAARPDAVAGLVLIGPFVRNHGSALMRGVQNVALSGPWGHAVWRMYHGGLFGKVRPADHAEHLRLAHHQVARPEHWRAFRQLSRAGHAASEAALPQVKAPALVIMGSADPDFKDPGAEARWVAEALRGTSVIIEGAGHYPQGEQPEATLAPMVDFLRQFPGDGDAPGPELTHG